MMEKKNNLLQKQTYISPNFELQEIAIEQNILSDGSGGEIGTDNDLDMTRELW
jgi:hypothetical protein